MGDFEDSVFEENLEDLNDYRRSLEALYSNAPQVFNERPRNRVVIEKWSENRIFPGSNRSDDVEQCEIPEEYKYKSFEHSRKIDVMLFLGIKRAKSIARAIRDWD